MLTYDEELALGELLFARWKMREDFRNTYGREPVKGDLSNMRRSEFRTSDLRKWIIVKQDGDAAAAKLIEAYMPLLQSIVSRRLNANTSFSVSRDDLVQAGIYAMLLCTWTWKPLGWIDYKDEESFWVETVREREKAQKSKKVDYHAGRRFSGYAVQLITKYVDREYRKATTTFSARVEAIKETWEAYAAAEDHLTEHGERITVEEAAERYGKDSKMLLHGLPHASANLDVHEHAGDHGADLSEEFDSGTYESNVEAFLDALRAVLSDELVEYMIPLFGLDGRTPRTASEIAHALGMPVGQSKEIERFVYDVIRHPNIKESIGALLREAYDS